MKKLIGIFGIMILLLAVLVVVNMTHPKVVVESVDLQNLLSTTLLADAHYSDVNLWGVRFSLERNKIRVGLVRIGIFRDKFKTQEVFNRASHSSCVGPFKDIYGKIGDQTATWPERIIFCRDNVLVELTLPESEIEEHAIQLDAALSKGGRGVTRGIRVKIPRIVSVELVDYEPKVTVSTREDGYASLVDKFGQRCHLDWAEKVCFATKNCIMADCVEMSPSLLRKE